MKKAIDIDLKEGAGIKTAVDIVIFNKKGQVLFGERWVNTPQVLVKHPLFLR